MKALTFETSMKELGIGKFDEWVFKKCWDAARQGMIPEDEAVRIDWSDPKLSTRAGIVVLPVSQEHISTAQDVWGADKLYKYIPRPAPAWTPKVGDAVFALDQLTPNGVWVARVVDSVTNGKVYVVCNDGDECTWDVDRLKPFDASKIGKPWDEIPGGK